MHSMDELLHMLHSDGADALRIRVGEPPTIVMNREPHPLDGPALTEEDAETLLQSVATTRQRRELREQGLVEFMYDFRNRAKFVVRAWINNDVIAIDIH